ncbi:MAG: ParB/RepB/Spo0J family partition protein [Candidatus Yanofskybacteria bacterium]|nr:ParB/RepB/Spo0J family partition protein [Candidatus Yanofskybacteria bacterium]
MKKLFGLGRGLESLIPTKAQQKITPRQQDTVFYVEINKVRPNPSQPRRDFDGDGLKELAASIKKYGILQPLLVSKTESETQRGLDVNYELIAGERRWRAAKLANLPHVPVIVKDNFDENRVKFEVALVENLQRENLNPMEEAEAYARLASEFKMTQQQVAERVGKSREVVANSTRLLNLPSEAKEALRSGRLSRTQARALLAFKEESKQKEIFRQILAGKYAVRDIEVSAREYKESKKPAHSPVNPRFAELEQNLSKNIGAAVLIRSGASGGNIVIKFTDLEELNKIVKTILD